MVHRILQWIILKMLRLSELCLLEQKINHLIFTGNWQQPNSVIPNTSILYGKMILLNLGMQLGPWKDEARSSAKIVLFQWLGANKKIFQPQSLTVEMRLGRKEEVTNISDEHRSRCLRKMHTSYTLLISVQCYFLFSIISVFFKKAFQQICCIWDSGNQLSSWRYVPATEGKGTNYMFQI